MSVERARELLAAASAVRAADPFYPGQSPEHTLAKAEENERNAHAERMALIAEAMVEAAAVVDGAPRQRPTRCCGMCLGTGRRDRDECVTCGGKGEIKVFRPEETL